MRARVAVLAGALCGVLFCTAELARAQEVSLAGKITDTTDAVLPGATVTALHVDTGNAFVGITDASGEYRINALRVGVYKITVELAGFATITQERVELLVGQHGTLNMRMGLSTVSETVTVQGEAPLVDTSQSKLGGNIDARQAQELPLNGRNWMQLTMLAPGSRVNSVSDSPFGNIAGSYQLNMDGQQVTFTTTYNGYGNTRISRDALGEFELVSSRFEATQGRSRGIQVNAVTKSGTNRYVATLSGYFRNDGLNAPDPIVHTVLPYSDQQISGTFGGPIVKDRTHVFGYFEGERNPLTVTFTSPYPSFNSATALAPTTTQKLAGVRVDTMLTSTTRLMVRGNGWIDYEPLRSDRLPGATLHPSALSDRRFMSGQIFATLTHTSGKNINEVKGGLSLNHADFNDYVQNIPAIVLRGYTIGNTAGLNCCREYQETYSLRDDYITVRSHHELKFGGEFLEPVNFVMWNTQKTGVVTANLGAIPANIESLFPVWNNPATWNLAPLSSITRYYQQSFGTFDIHDGHRAKPQLAGWFQDNWQRTNHLTLNLGLRWDFALDGMANDIVVAPFKTTSAQDWFNFGPRIGFAYSLPDGKTVLRGGFGKYFSGIADTWTHTTEINIRAASLLIPNDGRPNFAADPFNLAGGGHIPTADQAFATPGRNMVSNVISDQSHVPYSYQTSVGFQRQVGETMAFQADYVWIHGGNEENNRAINLTYNPATGANFPFTDGSHRAYPNWGIVTGKYFDSYSNYYGVETGFTRRMSQHWQASATYTLAWSKNYQPLPLLDGCQYPMNGVTRTCNTPLPLASDFGGVYGLEAAGSSIGEAADQRHRAVFNGIWEMPWGFQASGLYFFGSGLRYATTYGGDLRDSAGSVSRLRPDGTIVSRNDFVGLPVHRVDVRLLRRFSVGRHLTVDGIVEAFNVFNHANYGTYVTDESSKSYGQPVQNIAIEYQARMLQLGFRATF
jgi:hypothetical protein